MDIMDMEVNYEWYEWMNELQAEDDLERAEAEHREYDICAE